MASNAIADCDTVVKTQYSRSHWSPRVKLLRVLWAPFRIFFLRGTTRYLSPVRVVLLKLFGARLANPVLVMDGVRIWYPWNLEMGPHSALGCDVEIYNFARVSIGAQATVSQYSYVCTATHDYRDATMPLIFHPIEIGPEAWVAAGALIGPGVRIGRGAVVGARSVVMKDVADWTVVAGNPARKIRMREVRPLSG